MSEGERRALAEGMEAWLVGAGLGEVPATMEELVTYDPSRIASADMRAMFSFLSAHGYSVDIADLHRRYPEIGWQTFSEWVDEHLTTRA